MGVASGCGEQEVGVASGSGWNLWVWLLGVVVRRYIDFLILLYLFFFTAASLLFVHFFKCFLFLSFILSRCSLFLNEMKSLINVPTLLGILSSNKYPSVTSQAIFNKHFGNACKIVISLFQRLGCL